ncbi:MAG: hypothetical protein QOI24_104 [Acidobacteriota bacterium]|jgi:hypothetical protein|nr:hypothetical protein [Acidobacteriota bacterium]
MPSPRIAAAAIVASCLFSPIAFAQSRHKVVNLAPTNHDIPHAAIAAAPLGAWRINVWEDIVENSTLTETSSGQRMATRTNAYYGSATFNTVLQGPINLDAVKMSYTETTDDTTIIELTDVPLHFSPTETDHRCVYGPAGAVTMLICSKPEAGVTTMTITRQSQDVAYHAEETGKANVDTHEVSGPQIRLGATASVNVTLHAGDAVLTAQSSMTLVSVARDVDEPQNRIHGVSKSAFATAD